jgi:lipopolysaccharide transport system ATP-binding protein
MSDTVISVENVSKAYRLGQIGGGTLREDFARWSARLRGKPDPFLKIGEEHRARKIGEQFWALDDVSFQVKQGEVLGIIGRNGAGKSTLLKILSQVTAPTSGQIKIKGRIASLLEVGTGFHPELTGRENIFLNGAILGMTKPEIRKKFDEIVAFSEIEAFVDTPVKRYSSGMYVRLAFAVAAHLEPEILICDEVLAVGDAQFQNKCLGKMQDVSQRQGRTVLFVSHNMQAVQTLCHKGVVLVSGRIKHHGPIREALQQYLESSATANRAEFAVDASRPSISFVNVDKQQLEMGNLVVEVGFKSPFSLNPPVAGIVVSSSMGTPVFGTNPRFHKDGYGQPKLSEGILRMVVEKLPIHGGTYHLSVWLGDWQSDYDERRDAVMFEFKNGHPASNTPGPEVIGFIDIPAKWNVQSHK